MCSFEVVREGQKLSKKHLLKNLGKVIREDKVILRPSGIRMFGRQACECCGSVFVFGLFVLLDACFCFCWRDHRILVEGILLQTFHLVLTCSLCWPHSSAGSGWLTYSVESSKPDLNEASL